MSLSSFGAHQAPRQLGPSEVEELCGIVSSHGISKITIARSGLNDSAALTLARFLSDEGCPLEVLMLDGNGAIGDDGAVALGHMLTRNITLRGEPCFLIPWPTPLLFSPPPALPSLLYPFCTKVKGRNAHT